MRFLVILNDPPYGTERTYNGLRLAISLSKQEEVSLRLFLMGDAVASAKTCQKTPGGYYNLERMIQVAVKQGVDLGVCGSCMDARGLSDESLISGAHRGSMEELTAWSLWADKIVVF